MTKSRTIEEAKAADPANVAAGFEPMPCQRCKANVANGYAANDELRDLMVPYCCDCAAVLDVNLLVSSHPWIIEEIWRETECQN